jgi:choline dehydrogenase-like flavoprotein
MLSDLNSNAGSGTTLNADICVCGTGPAGITIARALANSGRSVLLVEGGGLEPTEDSQELYNADSVGLTYWGIENCRLRYFGGTSNHWSGMCGIFSPIDFEARAIHDLPGWPIPFADLMRFLAAASDILDLGNQSFEAPSHPDWRSEDFSFRGVAYSPPTRFGDKYRGEITRNSKIHLLLNANVIELELDAPRRHVEAIVVSNYAGNRSRIAARKFVLALGSLETARFLLNCTGPDGPAIGNHSDMVGRCFMEHLQAGIARFVSTNQEFWFPGGKARPIQLVPTDALMKRKNTGNGVLAFHPAATPRSFGRTREIKQAIREALCSNRRATDIARAIVDFDCEGDGVVTTLIEQVPNPASRVTLSNKKDRFGHRRLQLNWAIRDEDVNTVRTLAVEVAKEMARLDLARLQLRGMALGEPEVLSGHCHQMGTTRMSSEPQHGVVDTNCRVHGMENLFISGSSVFPTGGGTNPTLTIVMLSLRLAEHLAG